MVNDMMHECGRTYGHEDINKKVVEDQNKKISEASTIPLCTDRELKPTSLHNYVTEWP